MTHYFGPSGNESRNAFVDFTRNEIRNPGLSLGYRIFDLTLAFLLLPPFLFFIFIAATAIKISSPDGPVFFRQTRYGLNGVPFKIWKLRTMVPDAEALKQTMLSLSQDKGAGFKVKKDPRILPIGRLLRRTYIDEMPQIFNVLQGEMSIVGPRANSYAPVPGVPAHWKRLTVKPGITGEWQTARHKSYDFDERCRMDARYVDEKSMLNDIRIVFRTVLVCLFWRNGE